MKKVSELTGFLLDFWVAKAEGVAEADIIDHVAIMDEAPPSWCRLPNGHPFSPSTSWAHGGPIIEREGIDLEYHKESVLGKEEEWWEAYYRDADSCSCFCADTPLIAAMRAFVASRFGDEVPELPPTKQGEV